MVQEFQKVQEAKMLCEKHPIASTHFISKWRVCEKLVAAGMGGAGRVERDNLLSDTPWTISKI